MQYLNKIICLLSLIFSFYAYSNEPVKFSFSAPHEMIEGMNTEYLSYVVNSPESLHKAMEDIKSELNGENLEFVVRGLLPKSGFKNRKINQAVGFQPNELRKHILDYGENIFGGEVIDYDLSDLEPIDSDALREPSSLSTRARLGNWYNGKGQMTLTLFRISGNGGVTYKALSVINMPPIVAGAISATLGGLSGLCNYFANELSDLIGTKDYEKYFAKWTEKFSKVKDIKGNISKAKARILAQKVPSIGGRKTSNRTIGQILKSIGDTKLPKLKMDKNKKSIKFVRGMSLAERNRSIFEFVYSNFKWGLIEFIFIGTVEASKHVMSVLGQVHIYDPLKEVMRATGITSLWSIAGQGIYDLSISADFSARTRHWSSIENITNFTNIIKELEANEKKSITKYNSKQWQSLFNNDDQLPKFMLDEIFERIPDEVTKEELISILKTYSSEKRLSKAEMKAFFANRPEIRQKALKIFLNDVKASGDTINLASFGEIVSKHRGFLNLQRTGLMMAGSLAWAAAMIFQINGIQIGDFIFIGLGTSGLLNYLRLRVFKPKVIDSCDDLFEAIL